MSNFTRLRLLFCFPVVALAIYYACQAIPYKDCVGLLTIFDPGFAAEVKRYQAIGIVSFFVLSVLGCITITGALARIRQIRLTPGVVILWVSLLIWATLGAAWSIDQQQTLEYSALTAVLLVGCTLFWSWPEVYARWSMGMAAISAAGCMAYLAWKLPIVERSFGGVTPNYLGHFGFAILVLTYLAGRFRPVGLAFGLGLIFYSQARTVMGTAILFLLFYHVVAPRLVDRISLIRYTLAAGPLSVGAALFTGPAIAFAMAVTNLAANVTARDRVDSFSGRERIWAHAEVLIEQNPILGYGYRTRGLSVGGVADSGHSGILNCMLDLGLIGTLIFVSLCILSTWTALKRWTDMRTSFDRVAASFLIGIVPTLLVEPNYLNFSHPTSFLLFLFMAKAAVEYRDYPRATSAPPRRIVYSRVRDRSDPVVA